MGGGIRYPIGMNENAVAEKDQSPPMQSASPLPFRVGRYLRQFALRVVVYLVLYFLIAFATIGPFFWDWFAATHVGGPRWIAKFYAPLLWLCDRIDWLSWLVNTYVDWWIR
jgi:hypothetical protein